MRNVGCSVHGTRRGLYVEDVPSQSAAPQVNAPQIVSVPSDAIGTDRRTAASSLSADTVTGLMLAGRLILIVDSVRYVSDICSVSGRIEVNHSNDICVPFSI